MVVSMDSDVRHNPETQYNAAITGPYVRTLCQTLCQIVSFVVMVT